VSTVFRALVGIALGALIAAIVFLIMMQGSFRQGYTDLDFNHVLGTLIKGTAEEQRAASEALGVIGDTAGPTGYYATLIGAGVLMVVFAVAIAPFVRRHWVIQGLVLGALTALVVGVGFCAVADARLDTPTGIFGADSGAMTPLIIIISSLTFGVVGARCYTLAMTASWWEEREEDVEAEIESIAQLEPSLELPEEGPEDRRVGA
jgi:hypothetical protein